MSQSQNEPGLDLHEWETRWAELEEEFEEDAAGTLPEACDFVERMLGEAGIELRTADGEVDELGAAFRAAREISDAIERDESFDPGDLGGAIENLRFIYQSVRVSRAGLS